MSNKLFLLTALFFTVIACRKNDVLPPIVETPLQTPDPNSALSGFYLLNEGGMNSNNASLDFLNFTTGVYHQNIYSTINPTVVKELGDIGTDIQVYGSKLYAVLNGSNKVEVMDVHTGKRIGQIEIPNGRYIRFHNGKAYVSSYVSADYTNPDVKGSVVEIDTVDLSIQRQVTVGYQPEELVIANDKLYVANSGGYRGPNYDNTISVIDLATFTETKKIDVALNLARMKVDSEGNIFVSSKGDYNQIPSTISYINTATDSKVETLAVPAENFCINGDSLYVYSTAFNTNTNSFTISYAIINTKTRQMVSDKIIKDGSEDKIIAPYGIEVNPITRDIYITDAQTYSGAGKLYCYDINGKKKWETKTGDLPGQIAFVWK